MALSFFSCTASPRPTAPQPPPYSDSKKRRQWSPLLKTLMEKAANYSISSSPIESLKSGNWVKLICGASFEDVVDVRNLSVVYTLAGVDCIDCAAEDSVVNAVGEGLEAAREIFPSIRRPWVMVSVNDDQDLHFRKAEFDPEDCPADCSRPCEMVCPANAISLQQVSGEEGYPHGVTASGGVITERCYGCGRCIPVCPYDRIRAIAYIRDAATTSQLLMRNDVDAIEIHTSTRQTDSFKVLWDSLGNSIHHVGLVAVSLPDVGDSTVSCMNKLYSIMRTNLSCHNLWQLDGRSMSGDIGRGATREAIAFAVRLAASRDRPYGFLQLAGGTNSHTLDSLKKVGLFQKLYTPATSSRTFPAKSPGLPQALISGVAYGGYARKIVGRVLNKMQKQHGITHVEDHPEYLLEALTEAVALLGPIKGYDLPLHLP